jgi:hypothetical protein
LIEVLDFLETNPAHEAESRTGEAILKLKMSDKADLQGLTQKPTTYNYSFPLVK